MKTTQTSVGRRTRRSIRPLKAKKDLPDVIELVPSFLHLKSILVPTDFSEPSLKALRYAVSFARQFGAKITLLTVIEPFVYPDFAYVPLAMEADKLQAAIKTKLDALGRPYQLGSEEIEKKLVRRGVPFEEICGAGKSLKSDLIIISTHGYTGFKRAWMGSTAERVVRHASCPVLVVRQHEQEFVKRK